MQKTASVGARWDWTQNAAIKVQYDHMDLGAGSTGMLVNPQPGFRPGGKANVFTITLDFVF